MSLTFAPQAVPEPPPRSSQPAPRPSTVPSLRAPSAPAAQASTASAAAAAPSPRPLAGTCPDSRQRRCAPPGESRRARERSRPSPAVRTCDRRPFRNALHVFVFFPNRIKRKRSRDDSRRFTRGREGGSGGEGWGGEATIRGHTTVTVSGKANLDR